MVDDASLRKALERREQAEKILNNPLFQEICSGLEDQIIERWRACSTEDEARGLWLAIKASANFTRALRASVRDGEVAEIDLEKIANERPRTRG